MEAKKVMEIPIEKIVPNPYQPRRVFSQAALEELSNSIKSYGILQPITVRDINGNYELVAGERRFRAAKLANLEFVPAIINNMTDESSAVLALLENLQREDLNFIEEAMGYENLIKEHSFTQQQLAEKLGKNQSTIANKLRILRLPMEIKIKLVENDLTERHARALLKLPNEELIKETLDAAVEALAERGYNPVNQLVGYIISGDLGYISSYKETRNRIAKIDRTILVEVLLKNYLK